MAKKQAAGEAGETDQLVLDSAGSGAKETQAVADPQPPADMPDAPADPQPTMEAVLLVDCYLGKLGDIITLPRAEGEGLDGIWIDSHPVALSNARKGQDKAKAAD